jgi:hypothetical protein
MMSSVVPLIRAIDAFRSGSCLYLDHVAQAERGRTPRIILSISKLLDRSISEE